MEDMGGKRDGFRVDPLWIEMDSMDLYGFLANLYGCYGFIMNLAIVVHDMEIEWRHGILWV